MDDKRIEEIKARREAAFNEVVALCKGRGRTGGHDWLMSIPVQPYDSDRTIVASLDDIPDLLAHVAALEAVEGALLAYIRDAALSGNLPMLERAADLRPVMAALAVRWPNAIRAQESTPLHTTLQGIPDMSFGIKGRLGNDDEDGEGTPIDSAQP